jgi:hypothetical protein
MHVLTTVFAGTLLSPKRIRLLLVKFSVQHCLVFRCREHTVFCWPGLRTNCPSYITIHRYIDSTEDYRETDFLSSVSEMFTACYGCCWGSISIQRRCSSCSGTVKPRTAETNRHAMLSLLQQVWSDFDRNDHRTNYQHQDKIVSQTEGFLMQASLMAINLVATGIKGCSQF